MRLEFKNQTPDVVAHFRDWIQHGHAWDGYGFGRRLDGVRTDRTDSRQSVGASGRTRNALMPDPIVNSYDLGDSVDEIHEGFPTLSMA